MNYTKYLTALQRLTTVVRALVAENTELGERNKALQNQLVRANNLISDLNTEVAGLKGGEEDA